jgi:predicted MFS family arabinose efflux permease
MPRPTTPSSATRRGRAPGTALSALSHRQYRLMFTGVFVSNIGNWMQTVLLGAYAYEISGSASFVGVLTFCQLGPQLFLSTIGGLLADSLDRRRLLVCTQGTQLLSTIALAILVAGAAPPRWSIAVCAAFVGITNGLGAPAQSATQFTLVPEADVPGVVSLVSIQMNLSRVIGPAIGAVLYTHVGAASVFATNAATFAFILWPLLRLGYPRRSGAVITERGFERLLSGFRLVGADPVLRRTVLVLTIFSLASLTFLGLMPTLAHDNLELRPKSVGYGLLVAVFGVGAALGAAAVGTVLAGYAKARLVQVGLPAFAVMLAAFGLVRDVRFAYPVVFGLGVAYFVFITAISQVFQSRLDDTMRGRLMAVWMMSFGGMVPVGTLIGGIVADHTSVTAVVLVGAVVAVLLTGYARFDAPPGSSSSPSTIAPSARPPAVPAKAPPTVTANISSSSSSSE